MTLQSTSMLVIEDDEDDYLLTREYLVEAYRSNFRLKWVTDALTHTPIKNRQVVYTQHES